MTAQRYIDEGKAVADSIIRSLPNNLTDEQFGEQFALALATTVQHTRKSKRPEKIAVAELSKGAGKTLQSVLDQYIPDDWIRKSNEVGRIIVGRVDDLTEARHLFLPKDFFDKIKDIFVYGGDSIMTVYDKISGVNLHEFAHRLKFLYPDMDMMFQTIIQKRIEKVKKYNKKRLGSLFIDSYFADFDSKQGYAEALPLSLERILGQHCDYLRHRPELEGPVWGQKEFLEKDTELAYLVIGVLFGWK
ncbi:MAG: hypothetical protein GDA50_00305 [Alphaproteobacteria bacterium GM202ARS2]|nr:hypothetical protein [Alphaproteobacteria bacterium GM202ARS2]